MKRLKKIIGKLSKVFYIQNSKEELFYALEKLHQYNKPLTFLNTLGWGACIHKDTLTSDEVLSALEKVSFANLDDSSHFVDYHFKNLLDFLYSKNDYDIERAAKIEMKFIFAFTGDSYISKPQNLYKLMSQKPDEYFSILSQVYLPNEDELREAEMQKVKENPNYQKILEAGWEILDSFNLIPSLQEDGSLDSEILKKWVNEVRELAEKNHRVKITDRCIGKLLAKYSINMKENKGFPVEIYYVIEEIRTDEIKDAFQMQILNNLGFTSRGAFEGGDIEKFKANFFNSLSKETEITHSNVSVIFRSLRDKYVSQAKWEDEDALSRSLE